MNRSMSQCSVCKHQKRQEIDRLLLQGVSLTEIAKQFPDLSRAAIGRHKKNGHISSRMTKAQKVKEVANADSLIDQIRSLQERANDILGQAEAGGDLRGACAAIREIRSILELMAKVTGELQGDQVTVNVVQNPQFIQFRTTIISKLCPECRAAVIAALEEQVQIDD